MIQLEPWTEHDLPLLARLNAPEMTEHLGGPETAQQLEERHKRYVVAAASGIVREVDRTYTAYIYKVVVQPEGVPVGNVVFWDREWNSEQVYEMGWGILPEHQGRGIATAAVAHAVELARDTNRHSAVHAFPSVNNAPSNGICRRVGFELLGESDFEYPKGHWMRCNNWRLSLR